MNKQLATAIFPVVAIMVFTGLVFAAYTAHKDKDSPILVEAYPQLAGTALDDCGLCHRGGEAKLPGDPTGETVMAGACDFCHSFSRDGGAHVGLTLNSYGLDYMKAGADAAALAAIESMDSDGDGATNADEIAALKRPGDASDKPGLPEAPSRVLTLDELKASGIPVKDQTIFVNVSKSREGDSYRMFEGFMLKDVLELAGLADGAVTVDTISVDGYAKTFAVAQLGETYPQAPPLFGYGKEDIGECGWVRYDAPGLEEWKPLPDANILLTFAMQGEEYGPAEYDPESGKLLGYGPFRLVAPQMVNPGPPDNSSRATPECEAQVPAEYNYHREYEKNSDYCVKSVVAIRVNPIPPGTAEPDWQSRAMELLNSGKVIVYGNLEK